MPASYRLLLAAGFCFLTPQPGAAQQEIEWNLKAGDRYRLITSQDVALAVEVDGRSVGMNHRTVVQMAWHVTDVDAAEAGARVTQSVERVKVQLKSPGAPELTYDTAGDEAPVGPTRQLAAAVAPLTATGAILHVHPDGRITDVRLTGEAGESNEANSPAARAFSRFFTREGVLELSGVAHIALPSQPVGQGDRWDRKTDVQTAAGPFERTANYEFAGEEIRGNRRLAKISFTWKLAPRERAEPPLPGEPEREPVARIERQENQGVILFDTVSGHPVEAAVEQRLTFVSQAGTGKMRQQAASKLKIRISKIPPDAPVGDVE